MTEEEKEGIVNDVMSRLIAQSVDLKHNDTYRNLYVKNLLRFDYQNDGGYIYVHASDDIEHGEFGRITFHTPSLAGKTDPVLGDVIEDRMFIGVKKTSRHMRFRPDGTNMPAKYKRSYCISDGYQFPHVPEDISVPMKMPTGLLGFSGTGSTDTYVRFDGPQNFRLRKVLHAKVIEATGPFVMALAGIYSLQFKACLLRRVWTGEMKVGNKVWYSSEPLYGKIVISAHWQLGQYRVDFIPT
jgi:hypothetical protein